MRYLPLSRKRDRPIKPRPGGHAPYRTAYGDHIKAIYFKFIQPLLPSLIGDEYGPAEGVRRWFGIDRCDVDFYKARREFSIPGREWIDGAPSLLSYTGQPRRVKRGEGVIVRADTELVDSVEMEFNDRIFRMTDEEWRRLRDNYLEIVA